MKLFSLFLFLSTSNVWFMSFGQGVNFEISVECEIFVIVIFFNCGGVLQFGAHLMYYKGATQKRYFSVICTFSDTLFMTNKKNQNKHSILNSSFYALSKWHDLMIWEAPSVRVSVWVSVCPSAKKKNFLMVAHIKKC